MYHQSENSYFRNKGCVSVFDLRTSTADQVDEALLKYYFLNPFPDNRPVFLILSRSCYGGLIPWSTSIAKAGCRAMVIPHVEAGYPSEIPLSLIDSALFVTVKKESDLQKLRRARLKRAGDENEPIPVELFRLIVRRGDLSEAEERELQRWKAAVDVIKGD